MPPDSALTSAGRAEYEPAARARAERLRRLLSVASTSCAPLRSLGASLSSLFVLRAHPCLMRDPVRHLVLRLSRPPRLSVWLMMPCGCVTSRGHQAHTAEHAHRPSKPHRICRDLSLRPVADETAQYGSLAVHLAVDQGARRASGFRLTAGRAARSH